MREAGVAVSAEHKAAENISAEPVAECAPGKVWDVVDNRISMIFSPLSTASRDSLAGTQISLIAVERIPSVAGYDMLQLVFEPKGADGKLFYRPEGEADDILRRHELSVPFAVEHSVVQKADSLLRGNTYFIKTPLWYDSKGNARQGLRHIPVKVKDVMPGNAVYPLAVEFSPTDSPADTAFIYMTFGSAASSTRNFDNLFSFTDPRKTYPRITDQTWEKIIHSEVAEGMSRDEARLALGTPASIDRGYSRSSSLERWAYGNGVYLIFEDGILINFRQ